MAKAKKEFRSRLKKIAKHIEKLDELAEEVFPVESDVHRVQDLTNQVAQSIDLMTGLMELAPTERRKLAPATA